jgi:hypothetical protein
MKELWTSDIRPALVKFSEFPVIPCSALTFWSCKLFWTRLHAVNRAWPSSLHQVFPVFFPVPRESGSHETGSTAIQSVISRFFAGLSTNPCKIPHLLHSGSTTRTGECGVRAGHLPRNGFLSCGVQCGPLSSSVARSSTVVFSGSKQFGPFSPGIRHASLHCLAGIPVTRFASEAR